MFLRLDAKHIPEVREVTSQLAKQSEEQAAFREKSKAVQSAHAWQDSGYKRLAKMGGSGMLHRSRFTPGVQVYRSRPKRGREGRAVIAFFISFLNFEYYFRLRDHS